MRVKKAGFDGVQLHCAHNYMLNQFLSPYFNKRTDEYGGSLENRMRFLKEIVLAIRSYVGDYYHVSLKMTASDFMSGGLYISGSGKMVTLEDKTLMGFEFEESLEVCKEMEKLGVNSIELSGNCHSAAKRLVGQVLDGHIIKEHGYFSEFAKILADNISIPVITTGGIDDCEFVKELLETSNVGFFGMCRPLICEPDIVNKWKKDSTYKSRCVRCAMCRSKESHNYCVAFE